MRSRGFAMWILGLVLLLTAACTASRPPTPTPPPASDGGAAEATQPSTPTHTATLPPTATAPATPEQADAEGTATPGTAEDTTLTPAVEDSPTPESTPADKTATEQADEATPEPTPALDPELAELQELLALEESVKGTATIRAFHLKSGFEAQEEVALHTVFDLLDMYEQVTGKQGVVDTVHTLLEQGKIALIWWNEESYNRFPDMMGDLRVYDAAVLIINKDGKVSVKPLNEGGAGILAEYGHWAVQSEYGRRAAFRSNIDYMAGLPERIGSQKTEKLSRNRIFFVDLESNEIFTGVDFVSEYIWVSSHTEETPLVKFRVQISPFVGDEGWEKQVKEWMNIVAKELASEQ